MAISEGLDLNNLDQTTEDEVGDALAHVWSWRGPLYEMYATSLQLDYAADFGKISRWASDIFGRPAGERAVVLQSCQNIHSYMMLGWETGLRNEFYTLWRFGVSKEQVMEMVMFSQLYAGMRGLGHVYHAVGDFLPAWAPPPQKVLFPEGWEADPDGLKCGLDLSTRDLTAADAKNLEDWYERLIGYVPRSIAFGIKHNPKFMKLNRARWEVTIKTLPKQLVPYLMLRHNTITGSVDGLREAALLGKAWGMTPDLVVRGITNTAMYFTGFEGLYAAYEAVDDLLDNWD
jgi:hypothetical protein